MKMFVSQNTRLIPIPRASGAHNHPHVRLATAGRRTREAPAKDPIYALGCSRLNTSRDTNRAVPGIEPATLPGRVWSCPPRVPDRRRLLAGTVGVVPGWFQKACGIAPDSGGDWQRSVA